MPALVVVDLCYPVAAKPGGAEVDMSEELSSIECPSCRREIEIIPFLEACRGFWPQLGITKFSCPACRSDTEARIENTLVELGYVYAAGTPHFSAECTYTVSELSAVREADGLSVSLGSWSRLIPSS